MTRLTGPSADQPIRCLHFLPRLRLEDGGVVRAVLDLCGALAGRGHMVTLVTCDASDAPPAWRAGQPGTPRVVEVAGPAGPLGRLGREAVQSVDQLLADVDLLHLHTPWDRTNLQLVRLGRRYGLRYVVTLHGMLDDWCMAQKPWKKRLYLTAVGRRLLERAAAVHCTSTAERDQAQKWYPSGRSVVLPLVFDLAPYRELPGPELAHEQFALPDDDAPTVLFLGRLHPQKGVELLIEAAAQMREQGAAFRVVIAGSGNVRYENHLRQLIRQRDLPGHVAMVGLVTGDLKLSLYQASDLFVLPTSQESFGLVILEAMACGLPVITTYGVDIWPEVAAAGATVVDQALAPLVEAMGQLLGDPERCRQLGQTGQAWVFEQFNLAQLIGGYESLYHEAIAGQTHAVPVTEGR